MVQNSLPTVLEEIVAKRRTHLPAIRERLAHVDLDALLALAGELTSARLQLNERLGRARSGERGAWRAVRAAQQTLATLTDDLAREVLAARLEPARPFLGLRQGRCAGSQKG